MEYRPKLEVLMRRKGGWRVFGKYTEIFLVVKSVGRSKMSLEK